MKEGGMPPLDRAAHARIGEVLEAMRRTLLDISDELRTAYGRGHPLTRGQTRALTAVNALGVPVVLEQKTTIL
jgi:hypothetical protein